MLEQLRQGAGSWIAKIFIGLLVLSFAVWGISDIFTGRQGTTLAEVGDQKISAEEFQRVFQRELATLSQRLGRQFTVEQARSAGLDTQVLGRLVSEAAMDDQIARMNLAVPEEVIAQEIVSNPLFRGSDGKFSRIRFEQLLSSNGFTEAGFVVSERRNKLRGQVAGIVSDRLSVPKTLTKAIHDQQNEKRTLAYFVLTAEKVAGVGEPSESDQKAYYDSNKAKYVAPEYRKLVLLRLEPENVGANVHVDDATLRKAYEERSNTFVTPEVREVEQIVFPTLEEATAARKAIVGGKSFVAVAKERGFTESDINLGKVSRKDIPDQVIADAVFGLKAGEISVPISGSLSIVLLRAKSITPEVRPSFAEVKDKLLKDLRLEKAQEEVLNLHDVVEDERAGGATLAEIAKKLNLTLVPVSAVDRTGKDADGKEIKDIPDPQAVLALAFESDIGVETDPVDTRAEGFVWVDVVGITPSAVKPFAKVQKQIIDDWKTDKRRALLRDKAQELVKQIEQGAGIEKVAGTIGAKVSRSAPMRRRDRNETFSTDALEQVFAVPNGKLAVDVAGDGGSALIMQVVDVQVPPLAENSKDVQALADHLERSMRDDLLQQYLNGLRNISGVSINDPVWRVLRGGSS